MSRDPASVVFEADYWKGVLDDLRAISTPIPELASALSAATLENATLAILVAMICPIEILDRILPTIERQAEALRLARDELAKMQEPLDGIIELTGGRVTALRRELGLPDPEEPT